MSEQERDNLPEAPASPEPSVPPVPPAPPADTPGRLAGQALVFLGPILTFAGLIAIIRTGEKSLFYAAMLPIGLTVWGVGFYLMRTKP